MIHLFKVFTAATDDAMDVQKEFVIAEATSSEEGQQRVYRHFQNAGQTVVQIFPEDVTILGIERE